MKKIQAKVNAWRQKSLNELTKEVKKLEDQLSKAKVNLSLQKEKDFSVVTKTRHDIARLKTLINEKRQ